jgi:hypothetical protein
MRIRNHTAVLSLAFAFCLSSSAQQTGTGEIHVKVELKGSHAAGVPVQVIALNQGTQQVYFAQPEGNGFVVKGLPVSGYEVWAWAPGYTENAVVNVSTVSPKNSTSLSLHPAPAGSITAHVVSSLGYPAPGVKVMMNINKTRDPKNPNQKTAVWCSTDIAGQCIGSPAPPEASAPFTLSAAGASPQQVTLNKKEPVTVEFKQEMVMNNHQIIHPSNIR